MYKFFVIIVVWFCVESTSYGQSYEMNQWQDHFPLNRALNVEQSANKIFCASNHGLVVFDKQDNGLTPITKVNGLTGVGISTIKFIESENALLIGFEDGSINILDDNNNVQAVLDIAQSGIIGSTRINEIKQLNDKVYLCTGFGLVQFDMDKLEISDTYYVGSNGDLAINDVESYNDSFFVATNQGVYTAPVNHPFLSDKSTWSQSSIDYPNEFYSHVFLFDGKLYTNYKSVVYNSDTLYRYQNGTWIRTSWMDGQACLGVDMHGEELIVSHNFNVGVYDTDWNLVKHIYQFEQGVAIAPEDAIQDDNDPNVIWIADKEKGLVKNYAIWSNRALDFERPFTGNVQEIRSWNNKVWVAHGGVSGSQWTNTFLQDGISFYEEGEWLTISKKTTTGLDTIFDLIDIAIDPSNTSHVFVASMGDGVLEFLDNQLVKIHDFTNSSLSNVDPVSTGWYWTGVSAVTYDYTGNLWVANKGVPKVLSMYDKNGSWQNINIEQYTSESGTGELILTSNHQAWVVFPKAGKILIYNTRGTYADETDDFGILMSSSNGLEGVITSIAEDATGDIWIGTTKGVFIVYDPASFTAESTPLAQRQVITYKGFAENLLEQNTVTAIAVDGANRKWFGTSSAGVFLMNEDGTEELRHFTQNNSPLPSDGIMTINVNHTTGEVFFGTEKGIVSYRSEATLGGLIHQDVVAFPNPVRPGYTGKISVKGLVQNATIRITDVSGNIVYHGKAYGGQAVWSGNNLSGERVASGVYLVYSSNEEGSEALVTKILLVN